MRGLPPSKMYGALRSRKPSATATNTSHPPHTIIFLAISFALPESYCSSSSTSEKFKVISLRRSFAAVLFALAVYPSAARAQDLVSTRCHESEVAIDANHNAVKLDSCGDPSATNLLWHLDRIDQRDGSLDGQYRRRALGAGAVVYV